MLYNLVKILFQLLCRCLFRVRISGRENIPANGPVILASNHLSLLDPPLLGSYATRRVRFMAKEELFANPLLGTIIKELGAFPVRRASADRQAIKTGLAILDEGGVMAIFPEGTRSLSGEVGKAMPGVLMLAAKSGAAIVPVAISGTNQLSAHNWFPRFSIRFGVPYNLPDVNNRRELDEQGEVLMGKIRSLRQAELPQDK